jgi:GlpG protein
MRLVGRLPLYEAEKFVRFLEKEQIEAKVDRATDENLEPVGIIWIISEDEVGKASGLFNLFKQNPKDPFFYTEDPLNQAPPDGKIILTKPIIPNQARLASSKKKGKTPITILLIALSVFVYMLTEWTQPSLPKNIQKVEIPMAFAPPVMKDLLFDWPKAYEIAEQIYQNYSEEEIENTKTWPQNLKNLERELNDTTYWKGYYDLVIEEAKKEHPSWDYKGPMFEKIKEGQYYRLFTPALLHGNLLHILFNVMWIIVLGLQIERKIGSFKMALFVVITAIFSNVCQYLMSGPNFLGLSGIVIAMAGFIWIREKKAPWEGYVLHSSTLLFIAIYVFAMFAVQLVSFFLELSGNNSFTPGIANTAHIAGGLIGAFLGLFTFFERKHQKINKSLS